MTERFQALISISTYGVTARDATSEDYAVPPTRTKPEPAAVTVDDRGGGLFWVGGESAGKKKKKTHAQVELEGLFEDDEGRELGGDIVAHAKDGALASKQGPE
jgi:hypothetical protein